MEKLKSFLTAFFQAAKNNTGLVFGAIILIVVFVSFKDLILSKFKPSLRPITTVTQNQPVSYETDGDFIICVIKQKNCMYDNLGKDISNCGTKDKCDTK